MRSGNQFGTCAYCKKQVLWIRTRAGKNMPVNPEIVGYRFPDEQEKATEKIVTESGNVVCAEKTDGKHAEGFGYISHFATCSEAGRHRKRA